MLPKPQPTPLIGGYIPIRNDATLLSIAERNFIIATSTQSTNSSVAFRSIDHENLFLRVDGRKRTERRPISIQLFRHHDNPTDTVTTGSSHNSSTTTATVTLGAGTRATCTVMSEIVAPNVDRPNDGMISFTIDISPSANTSYRYATPASTYHLGSSSTSSAVHLPHADRHQKITSNQILRTLERCFVQPGGAIDTEALCVIPGAYVWKIHCACTILDDSGNIMDAAVLACIAAIRHYRQPIVELVTTSTTAETTGNTSTNAVPTPMIIPSHIKEPTPLPLLHTPVAISFIFIVNNNTGSSTCSVPKLGILIDPTNHEERCSHGRITIGMNVYKEICFFDVTTGYNCELQLHDIQYCHAVAASSPHIATICNVLESALSDADEQDRNQRLLQIKQLPLPPLVGTIVPPDADTTPDNDKLEIPSSTNVDEEEEDIVYRRRALDFTIGHVASKVRENNYNERGTNSKSTKKDKNKSNSLLDSMLKSLNQQQVVVNDVKATCKSIALSLPCTTTNDSCNERTKGSTAPQEMKIDADNDDDDEEEEAVIELKSEFVMEDSTTTVRKSTRNKRKR
jgi:exosome complex component RRP45